MAFKRCPECGAAHGPRKKMCHCGHYFGVKSRQSTERHPLYPEPGAGVIDNYHGLPVLSPPPPLPTDGLLSTEAVRDEYVSYEGLGFCVYSYIPADRIFDPILRGRWRRARTALQAVVEYLDFSEEEREVAKQHEELRRVVTETCNSLADSKCQIAAREGGHSLLRAISLLFAVTRGLETEITRATAIQCAKEACEELTTCASKLGENGITELAEYIRTKQAELSRVVARLLTAEEDSAKAA